MNRITIVIALALGGISAVSCVQTSFVLTPGYCSGAEDGDSFCAQQYPGGSKPYCRSGTNVCDNGEEPEFDGCVSERPEDECYSPCGQGNTLADDASCLDDETTVSEGSGSTGSTGGETEEPSTTVDPDTGSSTEEPPTTTGPSGCVSNEECLSDDAPFCDPEGSCVACDGMPEPDAACEGADPQAPVCEAGACVQCTEENAGACEGTTPICGVGNTCEGCTEHAQCPESACHLDGADAGACFDAADVQMVASTGALASAIDGVPAGGDLVAVLAAGVDFNQTVNIASSVEVALLGPSNTELTGTSGLPSLNVGGEAIVYLAGPAVTSGDTGVSCSGSAVWLDDAEVRNNAQVGMDVSGGCEAHLRRTVVRANSGGGIAVDGATSALLLENSVVADNVGAAAGPGVRVLAAELFMTYSVVVSNGTFASPDNLECLSGAGGSVRNSIISGPNGNSIVTCNALSFSTSAVDTTGLGGATVNVGAYDAAWFSPADGIYTLTASGETEFMDIAQWEEGDPLFDFEGDAIPTDMPSFPGYDQP